MILGFVAVSGWGKSYGSQAVIEKNLGPYQYVVVLDYKDEFRGLVSKECGPAPCKHWIAGPRELEHFEPGHWRELVKQNGQVVIARHQEEISTAEWRDICDRIAAGVRTMGNVLVVIDEAHSVAPQKKKVPEEIGMLATTGRGEGASSMWVTQRPAKLDEDIRGLWNAQFIGGVKNGSDIKKLRSELEYPVDVHKPGGNRLDGYLPDPLITEDGKLTLRKKTTVDEHGDERVTNSEWIYSDDDGALQRAWSNDIWDPECDHVGSSGNRIRTGIE